MSKHTNQIILLIDAENVNSPAAISNVIERARQLGHIQRAVAVMPESHPKMADVLKGEGVEIATRLNEMPKNAADAMLMMVAAEEAVLAKSNNQPLVFVFASNDHGFSGPAAMLSAAGHSCWRIGTAITPHSKVGFDRVYSVPATKKPAIAAVSAASSGLPSLEELLPTGRMSLSAFGNHLKLHYPDMYQRLQKICKKLSVAIMRLANSNHWPIDIDRAGGECCVVLRQG